MWVICTIFLIIPMKSSRKATSANQLYKYIEIVLKLVVKNC
jgi:hypothetical protein